LGSFLAPPRFEISVLPPPEAVVSSSGLPARLPLLLTFHGPAPLSRREQPLFFGKDTPLSWDTLHLRLQLSPPPLAFWPSVSTFSSPLQGRNEFSLENRLPYAFFLALSSYQGLLFSLTLCLMDFSSKRIFFPPPLLLTWTLFLLQLCPFSFASAELFFFICE